MTTLQWIALGVAGYFGWTLYQKYEAGTNLAVNLQSIDLSGFPNVAVTLSVQNITNTPLTIESLEGNVSVNGTPLGSVSSTQTVTLAPLQITPYTVNFATSLINLPAAIISVINQLGGALSFNLTGAANVEGIPQPVPLDINQNFQT